MRVYAVPNYECNLNCPHCELKDKHIQFDHDKFFNQLNSFTQNDIVILFGGEPTLYEDRFIEIMKTKKIMSVSTNLYRLSQNMIKSMEEQDFLLMSTSWNQTRFPNENEYHKWLITFNSLKKIKGEIIVLITMTQDLIDESNYQHVLQVIKDIDKYQNVRGILFEYYVGDYATDEFNEKCDDWLCKIHKDWNFRLSNIIENEIDHWHKNCSDVYTLEPDGTLRPGCPQNNGVCNVNSKCLTCEHSEKCQPCQLQIACAFPKKLYKLLKDEQSAINN